MTSPEEQKRLVSIVLFLLRPDSRTAIWKGRAGNLFEASLAAVCQLNNDPGRKDLRQTTIFEHLDGARVALTGSASELVTSYLHSIPRYKKWLKASEQNEIVMESHRYLQMMLTQIFSDLKQLSNITKLMSEANGQDNLTTFEKEIIIPLDVLCWGANVGNILNNPYVDLRNRETFLLSAKTSVSSSLDLLSPESTLRAFDLFSRLDRTTLDNLKSCSDDNLALGAQNNLWDFSFRTRSLVAAWDDKRALVSGLGQRAEYFRREPSRL